jgi:hypothetical protein
MILKGAFKAGQGRCGAVGLELDHVEDQLVGPGQWAHVDLRNGFPGLAGQNTVHYRKDIQGFGLDHHVLQLNAVALKEPQLRTHFSFLA